MFWDLKGHTHIPESEKILQSAATKIVFPAPEEVPWIINVFI